MTRSFLAAALLALLALTGCSANCCCVETTWACCPAPAESEKPAPAEPPVEEPKEPEKPVEPEPPKPKEPAAPSPAGVWVIDRQHFTKMAMELVEKQLGDAAPPETLLAKLRESFAKIKIELTLREDGTWQVEGVTPNDTLDEGGTWTHKGETLTLTTTKRDGKEHSDSKDATFRDGAILIVHDDQDGLVMRFVRKP